MKRESQACLAVTDCVPASLPPALAALLLAVVAVLALYHATFLSMLQVWWRSPTFAHGFLVAPVSLWLCWRRRAALRQLAAGAPHPAWSGLLLLGALGMSWLLAQLAHVQVMQQLAVIAMLPACVLAILGWQALVLLSFPLAYLFLCVPMGEVLLGPLIEFTASFTVTALQWSGVPVFREGSYFSLPSGNWSVVEACSGLRYLIASLALGALFSHLYFQQTGRRLAVLAAALLLPILANGVRAYLIVMLGHYSDMRLAVGVDHLLYGWLFFGLVALLLFMATRHWREPGAGAASPATITRNQDGRGRHTLAAMLLCLPLCAAWPLLAQAIDRQQRQQPLAFAGETPLLAVRQVPGWQRLTAAQAAASAWRAPLAGTPRQFVASDSKGGSTVQLQLGWYARQTPSSELLGHLDQPYGPHSMLLAQQTRRVALPAGALQVRESVLAQPSQRLLVWRFYRQSGVSTVNGALVKLLLARGKLLQSRQDGAVVVLSAPYDELATPPRALLQAYLRDALPSIVQAIEEMPHD